MIYKQNEDSFIYAENEYVKKNPFLDREAEDVQLPIYDQVKSQLPKPFWEGHQSAIDCYYKAWSLAFSKMKKPDGEFGFISNFMDTSFDNGCLFMWDSVMILNFGKYGCNIFNSQKTLDNFYSHQHSDGFICREIFEKQDGEFWHKDDPCSTGPNIMPWSEWEYYKVTGDKKRLSEVFYPLLAYHRWLYLNRTWRDGTYWSSGFGCGLDNQMRHEKIYNEICSHGHMIWIDACAQMLMSGRILLDMAKELEVDDDLTWLEEEKEILVKTINERLWDEEDGFYYDLWRGERLSKRKTVAAYWTLLADVIPKERCNRFVAHLDDKNEFNRVHRVPTTPASDESFVPTGGYARGAVIPSTNYMVLSGLRKCGYEKLAYEIARNHHDNVIKVFEKTGTVWENYSPDSVSPGQPARADFVGWGGLPPIAVLLEFVFGIDPHSVENRIIWNINLNENFGVKNYPFASHLFDLEFMGVDENGEPKIVFSGNGECELIVRFNGKEYKYNS